MDIDFEFDPDKDVMLRKERGIGFEEMIACLLENGAVEITPHHNPSKYPNQFVYQLEIDGYIWLVPAEIRGKTVRLITAYPSRKATKHKKGTRNEKTKKDSALSAHAKKWKLDAYEQELLQAFEAGDLKPVKNKAALTKATKTAAKRYFEKKARLNIRLTESDLSRLKRKAVTEGLPYQTLAASVLHKYVTGILNS